MRHLNFHILRRINRLISSVYPSRALQGLGRWMSTELWLIGQVLKTSRSRRAGAVTPSILLLYASVYMVLKMSLEHAPHSDHSFLSYMLHWSPLGTNPAPEYTPKIKQSKAVTHPRYCIWVPHHHCIHSWTCRSYIISM